MAAATVTKSTYGYSITGGTDATVIDAGKLWVKGIAFAGNATNATAVLTTLPSEHSTAVSCCKFKCYDAGGGSLNAPGNYIFFGDSGIPMNSLAVTLSATTDVLYVYLKF
jgi:hypothetical protein